MAVFGGPSYKGETSPYWYDEPNFRALLSAAGDTPVRALVSGSALGMAAALGIYFFGQNSQVCAILLNMAVFGAVVAYILQMASFLLLRRKNLERPYVSPL